MRSLVYSEATHTNKTTQYTRIRNKLLKLRVHCVSDRIYNVRHLTELDRILGVKKYIK